MRVHQDFIILLLAATSSYAIPRPNPWYQRGPICGAPNALLAIVAATDLPRGLNVPLGGGPTPTLVDDAADAISIMRPVNADCRFYNKNGDMVAVLPAGQTRVAVGPPQVLTTAVCDPCIQ
jgi:hypothetical protein